MLKYISALLISHVLLYAHIYKLRTIASSNLRVSVKKSQGIVSIVCDRTRLKLG